MPPFACETNSGAVRSPRGFTPAVATIDLESLVDTNSEPTAEAVGMMPSVLPRLKQICISTTRIQVRPPRGRQVSAFYTPSCAPYSSACMGLQPHRRYAAFFLILMDSHIILSCFFAGTNNISKVYKQQPRHCATLIISRGGQADSERKPE